MELLLIKESSLLREGLESVLKEEYGKQRILVTETLDYSVLFNQTIPDLVIIDCDTKIDLLSTVSFFKTKQKKVIVWSSTLNNNFLPELFRLNLDGYFYNGMEKEEVFTAINSIMDGHIYIHPSLSSVLLGNYVQLHEEKLPKKPVGIFSEREWEVLELLGKGFKNEQIAEFLFLSERTVKSYVSSVLKKMNVPDRTNAVLTALRNNWIAM